MSRVPESLESWALVGLGANLGDARHTILRAFERLALFSPHPLARSGLWRTTPVNCPPGSPPFINAVAALRPFQDETPESLLAKLLAVEREFGRARTGVPNEPRVLDLDLIAFGTRSCRSAALTLPHPRAVQRLFVLKPLAEIAPDFIFPGQTQTVSQLVEEHGPDAAMVRLAD